MQHIGLVLIDENANVVERSDINFASLMSALFRAENSKDLYPFLGGIDPYGDIYFTLASSTKGD
jgi:hypothetical protein